METDYPIIAKEQYENNKWLGRCVCKIYFAKVSVRKLKDLGLFERQRKQDRHLKLKTIKDIDTDESVVATIMISTCFKDGVLRLSCMEIHADLKLKSTGRKFDFWNFYNTDDWEFRRTEVQHIWEEFNKMVSGAKAKKIIIKKKKQ